MTLEEFDKLFDIEKIRVMVKAFGNCNESFLMRYRFQELMKIYRMWLKSGWTLLPDYWAERQVREALKGIAPNWDHKENPIYIKRVRSKPKDSE